jgi:hypothetical protein
MYIDRRESVLICSALEPKKEHDDKQCLKNVTTFFAGEHLNTPSI